MTGREDFAAYGLDLSAETIVLCGRMLGGYRTSGELKVGDMNRQAREYFEFVVVDSVSSGQ